MLVLENSTDRGTLVSEELDTVQWCVCVCVCGGGGGGGITVSCVITSPSVTCLTKV